MPEGFKVEIVSMCLYLKHLILFLFSKWVDYWLCFITVIGKKQKKEAPCVKVADVIYVVD